MSKKYIVSLYAFGCVTPSIFSVRVCKNRRLKHKKCLQKQQYPMYMKVNSRKIKTQTKKAAITLTAAGEVELCADSRGNE